ncbi:carbamate kinase [uncultured Parvimonas sp.]|uniref:carbamate kinase n=1 Tax=uncultured Parvimonas sp. TaxID=747372 RepID=UPI002805B24C|nr:carbamate kinase [uncultured Parvimonas sp.]
MSKIVVALGGNALGNNALEQQTKIESIAPTLVELIKNHNVIITHGNGPQIGQIFNDMESMPFPECGSMSQGYIGYQLQQTIQDELNKQHVSKTCLTVITQTLVDKNDKAFSNPTKPIGKFYTKEEASQISKEKGYQFVEDAGRGYRRVVPSPAPQKIIEEEVIKRLNDDGYIVIALGGGGIPVIYDEEKGLEGIAAVIDKDKSASLLARKVNADILLILTAVDKVCLNYGKENEITLDRMTTSEAHKYIEEGQFAQGSMLPKVEACLDFAEKHHGTAIIASLENANAALNGKAGTVIKEG